MNKTMLFCITIIVAIILASAFGLHIGSLAPIYELSPANQAIALYVCPANNPFFDAFATGIAPFLYYIKIGFFFASMMLVVTWGWTLYQSFLNDKFDAKKFEQPWAYTKMLFWALIILVILVKNPDYFRQVTVSGASGEYVLCEENTPGAIPVQAKKVK